MPATNDIVPRSAIYLVVAKVAEDFIVPCPATNRVVILSTSDDVVAIVAQDDVISGVTLQHKVTPRPTGDFVIASPAKDRVSTIISEQCVIAVAAANGVVAPNSMADIVDTQSPSHVRTCGTIYSVRFYRLDDGRRQSIAQ